MYIEQLRITNFRSFGPVTQSIGLPQTLGAFVGGNGTGKTAAIQALLRLFGASAEQQRVRRADFHIPGNEPAPPRERTLLIEAYLRFPELEAAPSAPAPAVAQFWPLLASNVGGKMMCRVRLESTLTDDGSLDGLIDTRVQAITTFVDPILDTNRIDLRSIDRAKIQVIYVPAVRDGGAQVTSLLKSRLWRAITWSDNLGNAVIAAAPGLNSAFNLEPPVQALTAALSAHWQDLYKGGTDSSPLFSPISQQLDDFVRKVEVLFNTNPRGRDRPLEELSDGQRSLFHIALTVAVLDIESKIKAGTAVGFDADVLALPVLTILALEEPENNVSPFLLSRIVAKLLDLGPALNAQSIVASHSAGLLSRIQPDNVRYFVRSSPRDGSKVRPIDLPAAVDEAGKYIREAVLAYPEIYFARLAVLCEGDSEELVLPKLAKTRGLVIDKSFVAIVPLGGRHINHFWKLCTSLEIPFITLLDLDWGRDGGGWPRIQNVCEHIVAVPHADQIFGLGARAFAAETLANPRADLAGVTSYMNALQPFGVYFSAPLDLDMMMLAAYPAAYKAALPGGHGPRDKGDPFTAVLGDNYPRDAYDATWKDKMLWYRYLFLGKGKPSSHLRALTKLSDADLALGIPAQLAVLLDYVAASVNNPHF